VDVNHCLMAAPGVALNEVRRVISHPQARCSLAKTSSCSDSNEQPCVAQAAGWVCRLQRAAGHARRRECTSTGVEPSSNMSSQLLREAHPGPDAPGRRAQALSQVDGYLRRMPHPEGVREAVSDTAGAAQMIADNGWRCASVRCAGFVSRLSLLLGVWVRLQPLAQDSRCLCRLVARS